MKKFNAFLVIILILCSAVSPAFAVESKQLSTEKVVDMNGESYKTISSEKGLAIQVKDIDVSKYSIQSDEYKISIKKQESLTESTRTTVRYPRNAIDSLKGFDGEHVGKTHIANDGTVTNEIVDVSKYLIGSYYEIPVEMSETIISGYTGYYQVSASGVDLQNGRIDVQDGVDSTFVVSVPEIADSVPVVEGNVSTYPNHYNILMGHDYASDYTDFSGNDNNGTPTNTSIVNGTIILNGIDGHVSMTDIGLVDGDSMSIYATVTYDELSTRGVIISSGTGTNTATDGFHLFRTTNGGFWWTVGNGTSGEGGYVTYDLDLLGDYSNEKLYISAIFDNSTNQAHLYINNILVGSSTGLIGGSSIRTTDGYIIGRLAYTSNWFMSGTIDNIVIYKDAVYYPTAFYTGFNGTSIKPTTGTTYHGFTNNTATFSGTTDSITFASTTAGTADIVTVTQMWTENTTLIEETETDGILSIIINMTAGVNSTSGYIEYEPINYPIYDVSLESTNPNASITYTDGIISISTGPLELGVSYLYNVTADLEAPPDNNSPVQSIIDSINAINIAIEALSGFVLSIVGTLLFLGFISFFIKFYNAILETISKLLEF